MVNMIFISTITENDVRIENKPKNNGVFLSKKPLDVVLDKILQLFWLDFERLKSIQGYILLNELEDFFLHEDMFNKWNLYEIVHEQRRFNPRYHRIAPRVVDHVTRIIKNSEVISRETENRLMKYSHKHVGFISNESGDLIKEFVSHCEITKLHPLQFSKQPFKYTEITDLDKYVSLVKLLAEEKKHTVKAGMFLDKTQSIVELIDHKSMLNLNSLEENDKIIIRSGDNYLVETTISYLLKSRLFNFLWDFRNGIPEFERGYDSLVLFNIDKLNPSGQSSFWLRVRDYNYEYKLLVLTSKDAQFKFSSPYKFKELTLQQISDFNEELLRILILLINQRTPKWMLWEVPKTYYEHVLTDFLREFRDITEIVYILDRMDLTLYSERIFSADFWYDFSNLKVKMDSGLYTKYSHNLSRYITPLSSLEYDSIAEHGKSIIIRKNNSKSFSVDIAGEGVVDIKKSVSLSYIYYLVKNGFEYPKMIEIEELYQLINGANVDKDRIKILHAINVNIDYLLKTHPKLTAFADCLTFSERGCFYENKGNLRIKAVG